MWIGSANLKQSFTAQEGGPGDATLVAWRTEKKKQLCEHVRGIQISSEGEGFRKQRDKPKMAIEEQGTVCLRKNSGLFQGWNAIIDDLWAGELRQQEITHCG